MSGEESVDKTVNNKESKVSSKVLTAFFFIAVVLLSYNYFSEQKITQTEFYGVKVVSDKPIGDYISIFQTSGVALLNTQNKGGLTCNFELLAALGDLSKNPKGYPLNMEEGEQGVFLYEKEGYVKGLSERELVTACNAFVCLANNITCPDDLAELGRIFSNLDEINIVLDSNAGQDGGMGYAELLGVLGYMQAEKVDVNKDGVISDFEINNVSGNFIAIRPYLMDGSTCKPQPLHNVVERYEPGENLTIDCSTLSNTLFILNSSVNKIVIDQSNANIYLYGDNEHLYKESVIARDALSPKWIRVLYQAEK